MTDAASSLPYAEYFFPMLKCIHNALGYCYVNSNGKFIDDNDEELQRIFKPFKKYGFRKGVNKHIGKGLSDKEHEKHIYPRLSKLTIQAFNDAQAITRNKNFKGFVLPSPLAILYQALTVPSEPQTAAYPLVLCRSMLFSFLRVHPQHPDLDDRYSLLDAFDEKSVLDSIASFRNHINIQARWPDIRISATSVSGRVNFLVGHMLALRSVVHLWFSTKQDLEEFYRFDEDTNYETVLAKYNNPSYRFRISDAYNELPQPGEVVNMIFGLPLPVRGADIIFFSGLKKTAKGGLVVNLSGKPGVGKTSFALSFAALLAPFNTQCIYISLEEEEEDLYRRLVTLIPEYLKSLSIYNDPDDRNAPWFFPTKIKRNIDIVALTEILRKLQNDLKQAEGNIDGEKSIPALCSSYIVIDNINELAEAYVKDPKSYEQLEDLISQCRDMGAIVVLVSGEDVPDKLRLDYLVDVSISLKQTGTDSEKQKPSRIFQLVKTRHQISRQGSHIFHLSGPTGFRICPQTPSQMDKKEVLKRLLPDKTKCILALNIVGDNTEDPRPKYEPYLKLFPTSQILIHGYGSTGKAGFALKILLTPLVDHPARKEDLGKNKTEDDFLSKQIIKTQFRYDRFQYQRKVLVLSFLYPKEYYEELTDRISTSVRSCYKGVKNPKVVILPFFPGYLSAEDFINKIVRYLDEAILEGEPYTGVLLDGLHNVFLQFKNLQENDMVWPLLYGILSRYKVTVVSTFTNFSLNTKYIESATDDKFSQREQPNTLIHQSVEDQRLMQKGQIPFLHSLVKASDFYLLLEEVIDQKYDRKYLISVRSAIDQLIPKEYLEWDRRNLYIKNRFRPDAQL